MGGKCGINCEKGGASPSSFSAITFFFPIIFSHYKVLYLSLSNVASLHAAPASWFPLCPCFNNFWVATVIFFVQVLIVQRMTCPIPCLSLSSVSVLHPVRQILHFISPPGFLSAPASTIFGSPLLCSSSIFYQIFI